jgi:hypothetical protein
MNLGDQRAGGVDHSQRPGFGFVANRRGNSMSAEYQHCAVGNFIDGFDENGAAAAELLYNIGVMNNLVVDIDRRAISLQRQFYDVHSPNHSSAKSAWPDPQ